MQKAIFGLRNLLGVLGFVLFCCGTTHAQITQVRPIDIRGGFNSGSVHITIVPRYTGDTLKAFDGNPLNALEMPDSDTLIMTLRFDSAAAFQKCKVFFWVVSQWTVEAANSLADLHSGTGTYIKLVDARRAPGFAWDSLAFAEQRAHYIRLRVKNPNGTGIRLGEWTVEGTVTFTKFLLLPDPARLLPGTSLQLRLKVVDAQGNLYPNFLSNPIAWSSTNTSIAVVDEFGKVTGIAPGSTEIIAQALGIPLRGTNNTRVERDFRPQKVQPMTVKVALLLQDPVLPSGKRIHEEFGWRDPRRLADRLVVHFREVSDSVVNFEFVQIIDASILFTRFYGGFLDVPTYVRLLKEPGWSTLRAAERAGQVWFDYREMVKYYRFDEKRNNGSIDEVWVFGGPFMGMYESQLMGPKAFWWNSPPIRDGTALTKLLSVMGLNYERGVDMALHSFGHRVESALAHAYFEATGLKWDSKRSNPTPWDLFTRIDKDMPGQAHVGNIHFPPNGVRDYDYGNTRMVTSYAENWYRYPYLFDQSRQVNVSTWAYTGRDPLSEWDDHLGYLRWWYSHLPRYVGVTDGVLNNWWHYAIDYEAAVALAKRTPVVGVNDRDYEGVARVFDLKQNFPNPFNAATTIEFSIAERGFVTIKVFDLLGREVQTIVNEELEAGHHAALWDASEMPSGVYFYRLYTKNRVAVRKMLLLK